MMNCTIWLTHNGESFFSCKPGTQRLHALLGMGLEIVRIDLGYSPTPWS